ncbi:MAG TPA: V-type ATPase subunit [Gemmatimonadales bacterium]|nr:V-type ATPase subunit [Gemmatimonadales bacterium]
MNPLWDAANVRARGLATHLLDRETLVEASAAGTWPLAARILVERGYPMLGEEARWSPEEFERASGGVLGRRLEVLAPWLGRGLGALAVIYEDEERKTLRVLLRGAAQGASAGARLRGLFPTTALPQRALERLARAESPLELADLLVRMGHPTGRSLRAAAAGTAGAPSEAPALWRMELALSRVFAVRATRAARRAGRAVRRFAGLLIDLENAWTLLLAGAWGPGVAPDHVFLPGGVLLDRARFARLAGLGGRERVLEALAGRFARTPLGEVFQITPWDSGSFESRALGALLRWQRGEGRRDPSGPGVLLWVMQRCRAEAHDVRLVSAAQRLGAPADLVRAALVTPS